MKTLIGVSSTNIYQNSNLGNEDEVQPVSAAEQKAASKPSSAGARTFKLRVALRSSTQQSTDDDEEMREEEQKRTKRRLKRTENNKQAKKMKFVKFEDENEEEAMAQPPPSEECGSDSGEDGARFFLAKREQNIKANKAMVIQTHMHICAHKRGSLEPDVRNNVAVPIQVPEGHVTLEMYVLQITKCKQKLYNIDLFLMLNTPYTTLN